MSDYIDKEFSAVAMNTGIVLCDKQQGAFIVLRSTTDLERLKDLLGTLEIIGKETP